MIRFLCIMLLLATVASAADKPQLRWDHYYDQDQVTDAIETLHKAYPDLTELQSLGRSVEGRDIWQLSITNEKTGSHDTKPAMYLDGAIHGNEIQATEVCLYTAWLLLDRYGEWDRITELLDRATFYVVPTVNVDSRARFFSDPGSDHIGRTARVPLDDDGDGLADEDSPEDLDGDGLILQMRVRDPHGTHRSDPEDPRVMLRVKPGEQAEWTMLGEEGVDNDGDGRVNEDGPGYLDMNRNWGHNWQPPHVQTGSGQFPFSVSNTRAVSDFLAARTNIGFAFAFHNYGGMWLRGPGSPEGVYDPDDIVVFDWLGQHGERTVPGYRYLISHKDLYPTFGDFDEFMYQALGVLAYTGEITMSSEYAYRGRSDQTNGKDGNLWSRRPPLREKQEFNDHLMAGEMFDVWTPFEHPQYGAIEIGGWKRHSIRSTPVWMLPETLHRNAMFVIWTAMQLPQLSVEIVTVEDLGDQLWRVRARAANAAGLPTMTAQARRQLLHRRDLFTIAGKNVEVVSGGLVLDPFLGTVQVEEYRTQRLETWLQGHGAREAEWIVRGKGEVTVEYEALKGGRTSIKASLK